MRLWRRSKPSVVEVRDDTERPQAEPATWPGNTSTPSPRPASRPCSERYRPSAPSRRRPRDRASRRRRRTASRRSAGSRDPRRARGRRPRCSSARPVARRVQHLERYAAEHDAIAVHDGARRDTRAAPADASRSRCRATPQARRGPPRGRRGCASRSRPRAADRIARRRRAPAARAAGDRRRSPRRRDRSPMHVGGAAEIVRQDLLEDHRPGSYCRALPIHIRSANARYVTDPQGARTARPRSSAGSRGGGTGSRSRATRRVRSGRRPPSC